MAQHQNLLAMQPKIVNVDTRTMYVGACSKCGAEYVAPILRGRGGQNRSRCDTCKRTGGAGPVTFLRGPNRGREFPYEFIERRESLARLRSEATFFPLDIEPDDYAASAAEGRMRI